MTTTKTFEYGAKMVSRRVVYIEIDKLTIGGLRSGPDDGGSAERAIAGLKRSVAKIGVIEPLLVVLLDGEEDLYRVMSGDRRLSVLVDLSAEFKGPKAQNAFHLAPCIVIQADDWEFIGMAYQTNLLRTGFTGPEKIDVAKALRQIAGNDDDLKNMSRALGLTPAHLVNLLKPRPTPSGAEPTPVDQREFSFSVDQEAALLILQGANTAVVDSIPDGAEAGVKVVIVAGIAMGKLETIEKVDDGFQITWGEVDPEVDDDKE